MIPDSFPPFLSVDQLAEVLKINRKTVYAAIERGEIPGVRRIGNTIRIARSAIEEWFKSGQIHASNSGKKP